MEKFPGISRTEATLAEIERDANFEGNDTELLLTRVQNPTIRNQIIDTLYNADLQEWNAFGIEEWIPQHTAGRVEQGSVSYYEGKNSGKIISAETREDRLKGPPSREAFEKAFEERFEQVSTVTPITFEKVDPNEGEMPVNWEFPVTGERATIKQISIAAAHEKGHLLRPYRGQILHSLFQSGFDPKNVLFTEVDIHLQKEILLKSRKAQGLENLKDDLQDEDLKEQVLSYLFTAYELAERMAQLKNYFGMDGNQTFTSAHLEYARQHYIPNTGLDNFMTHFFQAITPETEEQFLKLINSTGI